MTFEADEAALREAIVRAGARLGRRGLIAAGEGNLSIRLDRRRILITPAGQRKDELDPSDLVVVGSAPSARPEADGRRPSSDVTIHRAIYAARPDVTAVVHAHVPAAMVLSVAGEAPDPSALPETALLLPRLPFVPFGTPGSLELAHRIAAALAEPPEPYPGAAILERHGAVAVGATIDEALNRMELVDVLCRVWRDTLLIRAARAGTTRESS
jgi:L-fuculose-phosphate aldolase